MRKILLIGCLLITTGCSEFALLMSAGSIGVSQNAYTKAYNGLDVLTLMHTDKSMKKHIYNKGKELYCINEIRIYFDERRWRN